MNNGYYNSNRNRRGPGRKSLIGRVFSFAVCWSVLSFVFKIFRPVFRLAGFLGVSAISALVAFFVGKAAGKKESGGAQGSGKTGYYGAKASAKSGSGSSGKSEADVGTKYSSARTGASPTAGTQPRTASSSSTAAKKEAAPADSGKKEKKVEKKSYGPEIDPIIEESNKALSEMGRLYMSIKDEEVRAKINEIMRITDKIAQDAIDDPSDIPQIKKFFRYYLPTTIKLLNSYDRMASQEIEGENISKTMKDINEMLDVAIAAYKKRLDSLFEDQALDVETDIEVFNQMLVREGLAGDRDFITGTGKTAGSSSKGTGSTSSNVNNTGVSAQGGAAVAYAPEKKG